jgi:hypothetical protein
MKNSPCITCLDSTEMKSPPKIRSGDKLAVGIVIPKGSAAGLKQAADDALKSFTKITGITTDKKITEGKLSDCDENFVIYVEVNSKVGKAMGEQGYEILKGDIGFGKTGLKVTARTETGAMYGIYKIIGDLGVRYFHPDYDCEDFTHQIEFMVQANKKREMIFFPETALNRRYRWNLWANVGKEHLQNTLFLHATGQRI